MNSREKGFLLLTGHLGDPHRRPLTNPQLRTLKSCVAAVRRSDPDKELEPQDLISMGCGGELARQTVRLLSDQPLLEAYLDRGRAHRCVPLTRISRDYPSRLVSCLGEDAPGCLWLKGDLRLLNRPAVALVGSRDLREENADFAHEVGTLAARYGYVLISGNARGADTVAQESCLKAGGKVISVLADSLMAKKPRENVLYISEEGFDLPFTRHRALSRNRLIHSLALRTFVAQCALGRGGTWNGTLRNLRGGWSPVFCVSDGSEGAKQLQQLGAALINMGQLHNIFDE